MIAGSNSYLDMVMLDVRLKFSKLLFFDLPSSIAQSNTHTHTHTHTHTQGMTAGPGTTVNSIVAALAAAKSASPAESS